MSGSGGSGSGSGVGSSISNTTTANIANTTNTNTNTVTASSTTTTTTTTYATAAATDTTTTTTEEDYNSDEFYVRYYVGHKGRFGHEFMELELYPSGKLRYANNSNYKHEPMIRKEVFVSPAVVEEVKRIIVNSNITTSVDDRNWKEPSKTRQQELEIKIGNQHIAFNCAEIGSLVDIQKSNDPEGLKTFYYLTQDLKCLVLSLISFHYKVRPIPQR